MADKRGRMLLEKGEETALEEEVEGPLVGLGSLPL